MNDAGVDLWSQEEEPEPPLHFAAAMGSPDEIAELIGRGVDVDAEYEGRTALWAAVHGGERECARVLQEAGADVLRTGPDGWTPWRLSLVGYESGLLDHRPGLPDLSEQDAEAVRRGRAVMNALADIDLYGFSITCVRGLSVAEVVRRLDARPASADVVELASEPWEVLYRADSAVMRTVGVTAVPGGSVVCQPWAYMASALGVAARVSAGTVCYSMYENPKSGNQGAITRDGKRVAHDLHPGGGHPDLDDTEEERFLDYLFRGHAAAYCSAFVGLEPADSRAVSGSPDLWVELPLRDYRAIPSGC